MSIFCNTSSLYFSPPALIPHKEKILYRWSVVKENFQIFKITVDQFLCSSDLTSQVLVGSICTKHSNATKNTDKMFIAVNARPNILNQNKRHSKKTLTL